MLPAQGNHFHVIFSPAAPRAAMMERDRPAVVIAAAWTGDAWERRDAFPMRQFVGVRRARLPAAPALLAFGVNWSAGEVHAQASNILLQAMSK